MIKLLTVSDQLYFYRSGEKEEEEEEEEEEEI